MLRLSTELENEGRLGTSRTYAKTRRSFLTYLGGGDIPVTKIDARLMEDYNRHLRGHGLTRNTISFYNRVLRAVYNKAVLELGLCDCRPFRNVYTGVDRTSSRATAARNADSGGTVISEALGHSSERMTRIYLGSLDASLVDAVNRKLMERLLTKAGRIKKKGRNRVFPVI